MYIKNTMIIVLLTWSHGHVVCEIIILTCAIKHSAAFTPGVQKFQQVYEADIPPKHHEEFYSDIPY